MTDFHKLFMVKINRMIRKEIKTSLLVVYVIYGSLVYADSKETVLFTALTAGFTPFMQLLKGNSNANLNAYRAVYVCFVQFKN